MGKKKLTLSITVAQHQYYMEKQKCFNNYQMDTARHLQSGTNHVKLRWLMEDRVAKSFVKRLPGKCS